MFERFIRSLQFFYDNADEGKGDGGDGGGNKDAPLIGGKYKTQEEADKGIKEADEKIRALAEENKRLKESRSTEKPKETETADKPHPRTARDELAKFEKDVDLDALTGQAYKEAQKKYTRLINAADREEESEKEAQSSKATKTQKQSALSEFINDSADRAMKLRGGKVTPEETAEINAFAESHPELRTFVEIHYAMELEKVTKVKDAEIATLKTEVEKLGGKKAKDDRVHDEPKKNKETDEKDDKKPLHLSARQERESSYEGMEKKLSSHLSGLTKALLGE